VAPSKPSLPASDGELLAVPAAAQWSAIVRANHDAAAAWAFRVAGRAAGDVRSLARREALASGAEFSAGLGVEVDVPGDPEGLIVATGHQPEFYHPGVWIKDFLLQRVANETGASALDVVVDSDGFDTLGVSFPCLTPEVHRCAQHLVAGSREGCFACAPVPSRREVADWIAAVARQLESLPTQEIGRHFADFAAALQSACPDAKNLAQFVTYARRRFEATADTRYLELPATVMARSEAFSAFVADIAFAAERFANAYNSSLADYRMANKTRGAAQPFADLRQVDGRFELPLWLIEQDRRQTVWCERTAGGVSLLGDDGGVIARLPIDSEAAIAALLASGVTLAPKALALTLFVRGFVCDFFIHGAGGGGYDRVTDDVFRTYYGVEPPRFAVASITLHLPLGLPVTTREEVSAVRERLNRLAHNPDAALLEVEFGSAAERARATALAAEKAECVEAMAAPDAAKKALGLRIREINEELATTVAPLRLALGTELASLELQQEASEILTDRTYPFCFWSPLEVANKAG
jgi:hypothetical protein